MTIAGAHPFGRLIGAVRVNAPGQAGDLEHEPGFADAGIEPSALMMPVGAGVRRFGALSHDTFHGPPGMLADSLPDLFGTALIDAWLACQGRSPASFDVVQRLCFIGSRSSGATGTARIGRRSDSLNCYAVVGCRSMVS